MAILKLIAIDNKTELDLLCYAYCPRRMQVKIQTPYKKITANLVDDIWNNIKSLLPKTTKIKSKEEFIKYIQDNIFSTLRQKYSNHEKKDNLDRTIAEKINAYFGKHHQFKLDASDVNRILAGPVTSSTTAAAVAHRKTATKLAFGASKQIINFNDKDKVKASVGGDFIAEITPSSGRKFFKRGILKLGDQGTYVLETFDEARNTHPRGRWSEELDQEPDQPTTYPLNDKDEIYLHSVERKSPIEAILRDLMLSSQEQSFNPEADAHYFDGRLIQGQALDPQARYHVFCLRDHRKQSICVEPWHNGDPMKGISSNDTNGFDLISGNGFAGIGRDFVFIKVPELAETIKQHLPTYQIEVGYMGETIKFNPDSLADHLYGIDRHNKALEKLLGYTFSIRTDHNSFDGILVNVDHKSISFLNKQTGKIHKFSTAPGSFRYLDLDKYRSAGFQDLINMKHAELLNDPTVEPIFNGIVDKSLEQKLSAGATYDIVINANVADKFAPCSELLGRGLKFIGIRNLEVTDRAMKLLLLIIGGSATTKYAEFIDPNNINTETGEPKTLSLKLDSTLHAWIGKRSA